LIPQRNILFNTSDAIGSNAHKITLFFFFQWHYSPDSGLGLPYGFRDVYNDVGYQRHDRPNSNHPDSASRDI
jgi:hypothetical protein